MDYPIEEIEGIGSVYGPKLVMAGVLRTGELLEACRDRAGRQRLSRETGLSTHQLLKWANQADLMRVNGIGKQFGELLEAAGVDTIKELRTRRADHLAETLREINQRRQLAKTTPGEAQLQQWIEAAQDLDPIIAY
jgi:predicted flap endonuclease-1-like 5' DNA nuclease